MADFQNKVNIMPAAGIPGAFASVNPIVSTPLGRIASAEVPIGGFCWEDPDLPGAVTCKGTGAPLGFVVLDRIYPIPALEGAQSVVPVGGSVPVMVEGDFYVVAPAVTAPGAAVYCDTATGLVAASGQDTGFRYATVGAEGDVVIISRYAAPVAASAGA